MPKDKTQVVQPPSGIENQEEKRQPQQPLAGSKKVKNRNHSRQNHGEGS